MQKSAKIRTKVQEQSGTSQDYKSASIALKLGILAIKLPSKLSGKVILNCQNKEGNNKSYHPLYGVDEVTILEPNDKKILAKLRDKCNIYHRLILLMKLDTQSYYNIRMIFGLECKTCL